MSNFQVCVYCGSSRNCDPVYLDAAARLGRELARNGATIIYGGGAVGSMGALAEGALAEGGKVIGIIPGFMNELNWGHKGITELRVVRDIHERKRLMIQDANAVVALPGGSGTLDELLEAVSLKRLALFLGPIVVLNTQSYFANLLLVLESCITERFMDPRHKSMWSVVNEPTEVLPAIHSAPPWDPKSLSFAQI
ncbi:MAG: TIGR00730 family Rossman fold protein [Terriglobia bacterium]|jgi:uncharacterized protein (TIGR00730 family)